jgi:hypothetical protein
MDTHHSTVKFRGIAPEEIGCPQLQGSDTLDVHVSAAGGGTYRPKTPPKMGIPIRAHPFSRAHNMGVRVLATKCIKTSGSLRRILIDAF